MVTIPCILQTPNSVQIVHEKPVFFRPTTPTSPSSDPMVLQLTQLAAPSSHTSYQPLKLVPTCSSEQAFY